MYHFIVNPNARSGKGRAIWEELVPVLKERGIDYEVHMTGYAGHAVSIVRSLTEKEEEITLVGLGGDGTIHEIVNGIRHPDKVTLGYIPTGSGNDFARSFGISRNPREALDDILDPHRLALSDVCAVRYDGMKEPVRFGVSTGIGFDGAVCHGVATSSVKALLNKLRLGKLTYLAVALRMLLFRRQTSARICLDDGAEYTFNNVMFAAVMNVPYEGGGYKFCPRAVPDDGLLDVILVHDVSTLRFLALMPTAFSGKHVLFKKYVFTCRCRDVRIETDIPMLVHADGELIQAQTGLTAYQEEGRIRVITGSRSIRS